MSLQQNGSPPLENPPPSEVNLRDLFLTFLKVGATGFGGAMALLALIENEVITRRRWLSSEEFTEGVALAQSLPGPIAVDVIAYIGYKKRGIPGAIVSLIAILLPSFLMMLILTLIYMRYGRIPRLQGAFRGIGPAVVAVILAASWRMGKSTLKDARQVLLFIACLIALILRADMILVMLAAGLSGILIYRKGKKS